MRTCGQLWRAAEAIAIPLHTLCIAANSIVEWQRWVILRKAHCEHYSTAAPQIPDAMPQQFGTCSTLSFAVMAAVAL
jgi:hypothetical protein